jgi:hypothetical protein
MLAKLLKQLHGQQLSPMRDWPLAVQRSKQQ